MGERLSTLAVVESNPHRSLRSNSNTALSSTWAPAAHSSKLVNSAPLCEMPLRQAALRICRRTTRPAGVARFTSASRLNLPIRPRIRSFRRGCVSPSRRAASVWLTFQLSILPRNAIINSERARILAASAAVSSSASHTLANFCRAIAWLYIKMDIKPSDYPSVPPSSLRGGGTHARPWGPWHAMLYSNETRSRQ